jgi:hypothetical protein
MRNSDLRTYYCVNLIAVGLLIKEKNQKYIPFFHLTDRMLPDLSKVGRTACGSAEHHARLPVSFTGCGGIVDVLIL